MQCGEDAEGIPTTSASANASVPSSSVTGKPWTISSLTLKSLYLNEGPKSPWTRPRK